MMRNEKSEVLKILAGNYYPYDFEIFTVANAVVKRTIASHN